ncbi:MAG: amidase [Acidobacteria bacterium]|nr:amidase [Acidobacteriota bacterium]
MAAASRWRQHFGETMTAMTPITVDEALDRIDSLNPTFNAFISVAADTRAQAAALEEERRRGRSRGPLHGVPISVKDIIDVRGMVTTAASHARPQEVAVTDAPLVARLREAGAVIIGKCNLHEFALGTTNEESAFGPARNPYDVTRSPGGSSGGSAAAVAACMGWASIGSDTGGSIRIPAAACGVVGLKPSFGEIPMVGVLPLSVSLDHVGPLARTVSDAWAIYDALCGRQADSPRAAALPEVRLGKLGGYFLDRLDDEVRTRFEQAIDRLKAAGATVRDVKIDHTGDIAKTYASIALPEAYAYHAKMLESSAAYSPGVRERLEMGRDLSADVYVAAQRTRAKLREAVDAALDGCDALILPSLPMPAPLIGASTVRLGRHEEQLRPMMLRLTQLFNLSGHPAISLPCGTTASGLPCGFQLVGRRQATTALLSVALGCEPQITERPPQCAGG